MAQANLSTSIKGDMLTITVDLSKEIGPSKSGKTIIIATTGGAEYVSTEAGQVVSVNVNIYKKK